MTMGQQSSKTIFIMDMEHNVRELVRRWMADEGYRIFVFQDAPSCLEAVAEKPPDVLLADILTTSLSGMEIMDRIRVIDEDVIVILIYQLRLTESAMESVRHGAFDYQAKPLDRTRLQLTVKNAMTIQTLKAENNQLRTEVFKRRRSSVPALSAGMVSMKEMERKAIQDALSASNGNVSKAARTLGLGRTTLYRKMSAFGLHFRSNQAASSTDQISE